MCKSCARVCLRVLVARVEPVFDDRDGFVKAGSRRKGLGQLCLRNFSALNQLGFIHNILLQNLFASLTQQLADWLC